MDDYLPEPGDEPDDAFEDDFEDEYVDPSTPRVAGRPMASRGVRLGAAMIDGLIGLLIMLPIMWGFGVFDGIIEMFQQSFEAAQSGAEPPNPEEIDGIGLAMTIQMFVIGWVVFLGLHGWLLYKHGQTIGKRLLGTQIVDERGNIPPFGKLVLMRYLIMGAISNVPMVGGLISMVNVLLIFRANRRCLHDDLAGTYVVTVAT